MYREIFSDFVRDLFRDLHGNKKCSMYDFDPVNGDSMLLKSPYTGQINVLALSRVDGNSGLPSGSPALMSNEWTYFTVSLSNEIQLITDQFNGYIFMIKPNSDLMDRQIKTIETDFYVINGSNDRIVRKVCPFKINNITVSTSFPYTLPLVLG